MPETSLSFPNEGCSNELNPQLCRIGRCYCENIGRHDRHWELASSRQVRLPRMSSIKGSASETLEASNNYFLINSPAGVTIKSLTAGTLDLLARTPTTNFLLDTNYSYYKYFGPGAADTSLTSGTPASATFSVDHTEQLTKYNAAASWSRSDVATTNLAQTGTAFGRGSIDTLSVNGGITHDLNRIDSTFVDGAGDQGDIYRPYVVSLCRSCFDGRLATRRQSNNDS